MVEEASGTVCYVCGKGSGMLSKLDIRCTRCGQVYHKKCLEKVDALQEQGRDTIYNCQNCGAPQTV